MWVLNTLFLSWKPNTSHTSQIPYGKVHLKKGPLNIGVSHCGGLPFANVKNTHFICKLLSSCYGALNKEHYVELERLSCKFFVKHIH